MNAEKYRRAARAPSMKLIHAATSRWLSEEAGFTSERSPTDFAPLPEADPKLREQLNAMSLR